MDTCSHEFENANCTNCANGLPCSAYECAKTKGNLKEYCHDRAEEIHQQIRADKLSEVKEVLASLVINEVLDNRVYEQILIQIEETT